MRLRDYQQQAVASVFRHLEHHDDNPCVVIPTGGGKTPVLATLAGETVRRWNGRVVILAHVKELLEQNADKMRAVAPDVKVGVYSAGLKRRDRDAPVIVAGIQSVYKRAFDFEPFDLAIVDEAHLIPVEGEGMYRSFLEDARKAAPHLRVVGLTATPYRTSDGLICGPDNILNRVVHETGVRELIDAGYLSPMTSRTSKVRVDTSGLHVRGGEFVADEVEALMDSELVVGPACDEIVQEAADRTSILVFAAGVGHCEHVRDELRRRGVEAEMLTGDTPSAERADLIDQFRLGRLRCLVNVQVLTTGFDAPNVDCVVLLRPTMSPGLYYQMVGRGFRICDGKSDCLVLDYGKNIARHGPVDEIEPVARDSRGGDGKSPQKTCSECGEQIHAAFRVCPLCGAEIGEERRARHSDAADDLDILAAPAPPPEWERVLHVTYAVHHKRNAPDAPPTLRVEYCIDIGRYVSEWICFEHEGFARAKAGQWWRQHYGQEPVPSTVDEAMDRIEAGEIAFASSVLVHRDGKYWRIKKHRVDRPVEVPPIPDDEIPF